MKRARKLSPIEPLKPAKRQKLSTGDDSLAICSTPVQTCSKPGRGLEKATVQALSEEPESSVPKGVLPRATPPAVGGAKSGKPLSCPNGVWPGSSKQHSVEGERTTGSTLFSTVGTSREASSGHRRTDTKHRGAKVMPEADSTFKFEQLFGYYPPKLTLQDGDLCPEHSLSVSGMERSKLNSLPPTHPIWNWTLGQPINKAAAPGVKTSRRKQKSKSTNNVS